MDISTRLMSITMEFVFMPVQAGDKKLRGIFDSVSESHSITSFSTLPDGSTVMSTKEEKSNLSRYRILRDKVVITYEFCSNSINYYSALASDFLSVFAKTAGVSLILMHSIIIRKLVNLRQFEDGRDYLIKKALSLTDEDLKVFARPLHVIGTRMFFPAVDQGLSAYDIKVESWGEDTRSIFIECAGIYSAPADIGKDVSVISIDTDKTDDFISNNILGFLKQFGGR
jgi:hypothetical protein